MVRWRCFVHLSLIFETPICATFTVNIYFTCFLYILTHVTIGELDVACSTDDYCWLVSVTAYLQTLSILPIKYHARGSLHKICINLKLTYFDWSHHRKHILQHYAQICLAGGLVGLFLYWEPAESPPGIFSEYFGILPCPTDDPLQTQLQHRFY